MKSIMLLLLLCTCCINVFALTEKEVYCYIKKVGIKHPEVVLRQAIIESGHFKSVVFKTRNNLFGFRNKVYIKFDTWKTCIEYYKRWQLKYYKNEHQNYYAFLQKRNFSSHSKSRYESSLKRVKFSIDIEHCNCEDE